MSVFSLLMFGILTDFGGDFHMTIQRLSNKHLLTFHVDFPNYMTFPRHFLSPNCLVSVKTVYLESNVFPLFFSISMGCEKKCVGFYYCSHFQVTAVIIQLVLSD